MKNIFVFVVCGAQEHIDTLHFSLDYLKKYSKNEILIITDSSRNEIGIEHESIIDIETPAHFNNHQASIYLKTGIHKFLPKGNNYCYLDTDVVALNNEVDFIFNEYKTPITFAPDHCKVNQFSPYAVNCSCLEKFKAQQNEFEKASEKHDRNIKITDASILEQQKKLLAHFESLKNDFIKKAITALRYFSSIKKFNLNEDFYFDKKQRSWIYKPTNQAVLHEVPVKKIEQETGFKYSKWTQQWLNKNGEDIWQVQCTHLPAFIQSKFDIDVVSNWQHWNGGVFLFNDSSHDFLNTWHNKTMEIFKDKNWKTRDQGTLITTANEFGLQKHPTLDKKWNFIADYYKNSVDFKENGLFTDDNWKTNQKVNFVHIYHHWADETWSLWNWVLTKNK